MSIIGFTGSQRGMTNFQKRILKEILELKQCTEFAHGDCIGSDAEANEIAFDFGVRIFSIYPPLNQRKQAHCFPVTEIQSKYDGQFRSVIYRGITIQVRWFTKDEYLARNKKIVDHSQWMIACPKEHQHSIRSGTWSTIRYAWKIKKDLTIIPPIEREEDDK